jgi:hypothetical protein
MTLCSPVEAHRPFGGTYYLHFQGRNVDQAHDQKGAINRQKTVLAAEFLVFTWFFLDAEYGGSTFLRNIS